MGLKILHCGDLHVDEGNRLDQAIVALKFLRAEAERLEVNLSVLNGDIFGMTVPYRATPTERGIVSDLIVDLAVHGEVIVNLGNHDTDVDLGTILRVDAPSTVAWHRLGFADTSALQARLVAEKNPDAAKKVISALRGVLKASKRLGLMTADAFDRAVELERIRGSRIRNVKNLAEHDLENLLAATRSDSKPMRALRDRAMLALLAGGGLRRAEAASVTTADLNGRVLVVTGKGNKQRIVPLPEWATRSIAEFVERRGFSGPILTRVSQRGEVLRERLAGGQAVYIVARRLWRRAGLQPIGCHSFRRDFCVRLMDSGADVFAAQQILGHASPQTTSIYARRTVDKLAVVVDRLADPENGTKGTA